MSSKPRHNRFNQRRSQLSVINRRRANKRPHQYACDPVTASLIRQFNEWCMNLRTLATYQYDRDERGKHRCKIILPIFPNLQSIGHGSFTKKESKRHAIVTLFAQLEKRKQIGLFVPYPVPPVLRSIQVEIDRANVSIPDLNQSTNEYLLAERTLSKSQVPKKEKMMKTIERVCNVRIIILSQMTNSVFVYVVGAKAKTEMILPYLKALFQPETELLFNYGEKFFDIFNDQAFLDGVCQRLKVLCNNQIEKCKLYILGSVVNAQCCYNEFALLRREFDNEAQRCLKPVVPIETEVTKTGWCEMVTTVDQAQSTHIESDEKETDQLPDYSFYDDDVNASILRVLQEEDKEEKPKKQESTVEKETRTTKVANNLPILIELSDDSDTEDLKVVPIVNPKNQIKNIPSPQPQPSVPQPSNSHLRHIVLDGQNVARNSNDYNGSFSWLRLYNAIQFFKKRAHENIIAFLPLYVRDSTCKRASVAETEMERMARDEMINARLIAFTPSRYNNGKRLTNYDDRFILQYAADNDGIVVSNDNFRDLQHEPNFQFVINNRVLPFATINDTFMPATDPLGRNGPTLDTFLSKNILVGPPAFNSHVYQHRHQSNLVQHPNYSLFPMMPMNVRVPPAVYYSS